MIKPAFDEDGFTIYHGDVLDVLKQLGPDSVDAIITDPPYCSGGRQTAGARNTISKSDTREDEQWFLGDNMGSDSYIWWMRQVAGAALTACRPGSMGFVFTDWRQYTTVVTAWETMRWTLRSAFMWDKDPGGAMGSYWRNNHEMGAIFTKGKPRPLAHRSAFNTWTGAKPQGGLHPTEKPLRLMEYIVSAVSPIGGIILDPLAGSGTTGIPFQISGCAAKTPSTIFGANPA